MERSSRHDGRMRESVRPLKVSYDNFGYADSSVLIELGQTKILASITLQQGVPPFLKGQRTGWLSAEYAMLPAATHQRTNRESSQAKQNARSVEISRLIGRCLRTTVDLSKLGERTIIVDCDVLQADGGTRVASITAASIALERAASLWLEEGIVSAGFFKTRIAAVSVGIVDNNPLVDLSYIEDSAADADFNFVMTQEGDLVEIQGTAEKTPVSWDVFENLKTLAIKGITTIFNTCSQIPFPPAKIKQQQNNTRPSQQVRQQQSMHGDRHQSASPKQALFSLGNRFSKTP